MGNVFGDGEEAAEVHEAVDCISPHVRGAITDVMTFVAETALQVNNAYSTDESVLAKLGEHFSTLEGSLELLKAVCTSMMRAHQKDKNNGTDLVAAEAPAQRGLVNIMLESWRRQLPELPGTAFSF